MELALHCIAVNIPPLSKDIYSKMVFYKKGREEARSSSRKFANDILADIKIVRLEKTTLLVILCREKF